MAKTFSGGALIPYGDSLPVTNIVSDGALFFRTNAGVASGLYLYGFIKDANNVAIGPQVAQNWLQISFDPTNFVLKTGDTMTGNLVIENLNSGTTFGTGENFLTFTNTGPANGWYGLRFTKSNGANHAAINEVGTSLGNGILSFGVASGGSMVDAFRITPTTITFLGNTVWHSGNDGAGSSLDADLLDGQQGSFYQNATNITAGTLAVARGGTGNGAAPAPGGVAYAISGTQYGATAAGTAGQVLLSAGAGTPVWTNQSALSVGNATNANFATTAGTATTATTATNNVLKAGDTMTGNLIGTAFRAAQGAPNNLDSSTNGFAFGADGDSGLFSVGSGATGTSVSLYLNNAERFRITSSQVQVVGTGAGNVWTTGTLTDLGQLANGPGYVTSAALSAYVLKTGDTMTGSLVVGNGAGDIIQVNGISLHWSSSLIQTTGAVSAAGNVLATGAASVVASQNGNVVAGHSGVGTASASGNGYMALIEGSPARTGYSAFYAFNGNRQGYIGYSTGTGSTDTGTLNYVAGAHTFNSQINGTIFNGTATQANYADLAERYTSVDSVPVGTVMVIGRDERAEATVSYKRGQRVLGVVSDKPAFLMNKDCDGPALALRGRVPVFVTGPVSKGDLLIASDDGSAIVQVNDRGSEFAQALVTDLRTERRLVECAVF